MGWTCKARRTADPPEDCDWPFCGCDPGAERVVEALEESGYLLVREASEPVEIVRAIIYASDQCQGHRGCEHSMEPWQRARELLTKIDEAAQDGGPQSDGPGVESQAAHDVVPGAGGAQTMSKPTTVVPSAHEAALQALLDDLIQSCDQPGDGPGAELLAEFMALTLDVVRAHVERLPELASGGGRLAHAPFAAMVRACHVVEQDLQVLADGVRAGLKR